jgi:hypothetical protein
MTTNPPVDEKLGDDLSPFHPDVTDSAPEEWTLLHAGLTADATKSMYRCYVDRGF